MNEYGLLTHSFNVGIAVEYGVNEAIVLDNLFQSVEQARENDHNYHDGRYWTYNSAAAFTKLFPYFTEKQVWYTLKKLEENGLILVGNYNENHFDRTKWYTLTDRAYEMYGQTTAK